jgi:membrane associated rhomboid family serine protease
MFIPWNTDAPIYHFPYATIGLIGANVLVLGKMLAGGGEGLDEWLYDYALVYGDGLHPLQWVTSLFIHAGFEHLIGNMVFLWTFGLIVEGKLGWWKFLAIYFGLGVLQNAAEQSMSFWFSEGISFGASAVVYGLMAMSLVWAPENEVSCVGFFLWRVFTFEIRVFWLAVLYIGIDVMVAWLNGFGVSSELFHVFGASLGFGLATLMIKRDWVDCENWDLYSVFAGRHKKDTAPHIRTRRSVELSRVDVESTAADDPQAERRTAPNLDKSLKKLQSLLAQKNGWSALAHYRQVCHYTTNWELPETELLQLADLLCQEKQLNEAVPFLEAYLRNYQKRAVQVRLKLAQILVEEQQRPTYASRVLAELPAEPLPPQFEKVRAALLQKAQKMIDDGVLELEGRAW